VKLSGKTSVFCQITVFKVDTYPGHDHIGYQSENNAYYRNYDDSKQSELGVALIVHSRPPRENAVEFSAVGHHYHRRNITASGSESQTGEQHQNE
jgi:hypothetical protein